MCGIVGYAGSRPATPILVRALRDLEYRGYDSAGIAILGSADGEGVEITKRVGKIANLESALDASPGSEATTGIGHTRWATHGRPSDLNAHPHTSCGGEVVVIHNGIVENYAALRSALIARGHAFASETDTETIAHLLEERTKSGLSLLESLRLTIAELEGSHAIVAMSPSEPGAIVAARVGNAGGVVIGYGEGEMLVASDLAAILPHTQQVAFLAGLQLARVDRSGASFINGDGSAAAVEPRRVPIDPVSALKGQYEHFMLKEIMEQPEALSDTIRSLVTLEPAGVHLDDLGPISERLSEVRRVILIGMGTSLHAAMVGRAFIERLAGVPAETDNASEFRYRDPVIGAGTLVVSVSQSGETVDVLEAMAVAKAKGAMQVTICNTEGAQTTRVADGTVYTRAGLERGVASTKCFTTAMVALYALALRLGEANGHLGPGQLGDHIQDLARLPDAAARVLQDHAPYKTLANHFYDARHFLFLGRGLAFPVAMEGALKLKEISYIHAEGYAAGEMKHGPIALIDRGFPTVAVAPAHALRSKLISNVEQIQARGGEVLAIASEGDQEVAALANHAVFIPAVSEFVEPFVATLPLQCLSYYIALRRGCDVDQPRNLAKTVTVE
ncbi:MAG: glutamine--fructose-6-phosphate transaminase (isomerizing) [Dehalococcoidia bacterium]|nr:glutamine--fructose-6-phosphate transaminase (isomerizing) [Chloroflexi bacterium CFX7]MCK6565993.1 glutamine--fructose-6-phosphate transaminase (isomerizing) [Dehalococcoidia bacterium]NUQ54291.1 glutamine--fructose-6-phosphate transaminase (isomerizing) [Dehalococcoidia bacterium]RIL04271.1 MAG: glutamine--fructose-6-phosphate transaminase (isomerizing) [bacterium]